MHFSNGLGSELSRYRNRRCVGVLQGGVDDIIGIDGVFGEAQHGTSFLSDGTMLFLQILTHSAKIGAGAPLLRYVGLMV